MLRSWPALWRHNTLLWTWPTLGRRYALLRSGRTLRRRETLWSWPALGRWQSLVARRRTRRQAAETVFLDFRRLARLRCRWSLFLKLRLRSWPFPLSWWRTPLDLRWRRCSSRRRRRWRLGRRWGGGPRRRWRRCLGLRWWCLRGRRRRRTLLGRSLLLSLLLFLFFFRLGLSALNKAEAIRDDRGCGCAERQNESSSEAASAADRHVLSDPKSLRRPRVPQAKPTRTPCPTGLLAGKVSYFEAAGGRVLRYLTGSTSRWSPTPPKG